MLAAGGIKSEVIIKSGTGLVNRLSVAEFDLYLGEIDVAADFDFSFLIGYAGSSNYGGFYNEETNNLLASYAEAGTVSTELIARQISEKVTELLPVIPIGYKLDYVYINREYKIGNVKVTETDPFFNVFEWKMN